jgi:hypothetical protein
MQSGVDRQSGSEVVNKMRRGHGAVFWGLVFFLMGSVSWGFADEGQLHLFLSKASKNEELSSMERIELLKSIEMALEQAKKTRTRLVQAIETGDMEIRYQDGNFWLGKLDKDRGSIESAIQQLKAMRENSASVLPSMKLYKALKDISFNFNNYNNMPPFSGLVGDLAPEIELWADPVFYRLYLLPLCRTKDREPDKVHPQPRKEKKPTIKMKKTE